MLRTSKSDPTRVLRTSQSRSYLIVKDTMVQLAAWPFFRSLCTSIAWHPSGIWTHTNSESSAACANHSASSKWKSVCEGCRQMTRQTSLAYTPRTSTMKKHMYVNTHTHTPRTHAWGNQYTHNTHTHQRARTRYSCITFLHVYALVQKIRNGKMNMASTFLPAECTCSYVPESVEVGECQTQVLQQKRACGQNTKLR